MKIQELDSNMAQVSLETEFCWKQVSAVFLEGFAFYDIDKVYRRMPLDTEETFKIVNPCINDLSEDTAGGQIRFKTNSDKVALRVKLDCAHNMVNMTAAAQCGFDLYVKYEKEPYRFKNITKFDITNSEYEVLVDGNLGKEYKEILLNFPLYMGVKSVEIGLTVKSEILPPCPHTVAGKMVFYGTSITQGGCASRPGMAYTNIISRHMDCEAINLGFSGNGLGEYEVAEVIARISEANIIVLDYEANAASNGRLEKSLVGFIDTVRTKLPIVPILVISRIPVYGDFYNADMRDERNKLRQFASQTVKKFNNNGDKNIYFLDGYSLLPTDFFDCTVDGLHPTDVGFKAMAEGLLPIIREILTK